MRAPRVLGRGQPIEHPLRYGAFTRLVVARAPVLLATPFAGSLAMRFDRRRLSASLTLLQLVPTAVLAIRVLTAGPTVAEIYLLVAAAALPSALVAPVLTLMTPSLVPEPLGRHALATADVAYNVSRTAGPALGGVIVTAIGAGQAVGLNAISFVVVLLAVLTLPRAAAGDTERDPAPVISFPRAVRVSWEKKLVVIALAYAVLFFFAVGPVEQVAPAIAEEHGTAATYIGWMLAALSLGGIVANPLIRRLHERGIPPLRMIAVATVLAGMFMIGFGVSHWLWSDLLFVFLIGGTWELMWVLGTTLVRYGSPDGAAAHLMGLLFMISSAGISLGALLAGLLFQIVGVEISQVAPGGFLMLAGLAPLLLARDRIRERLAPIDSRLAGPGRSDGQTPVTAASSATAPVGSNPSAPASAG
jgi:predicted MFS family arabinose efflux permease